jgi:hypothetical protein
MTTASNVPVRYPSGVTTDPKSGILANFGLPNPLFYNVIEDDFNGGLNTNLWTKYLASAGTVAPVAGDGGRLLFTTAATSGDVVAIQPSVGVMTLTALKKTFFVTRLRVSSIAAAGPTVVAGLIDVTATPNLTITDGLYFSINNGVATFNATVGSVTTTIALPTTCYATQANPIATAMVATTDYDMGFFVDRNQNIAIFFAQQLVGWLPQSGTGAVYPNDGVTVAPNPGPAASLNQSTTAVTLTTALLAPALVLSEGTGAAAVTMNSDFILAAKER